MSIIKHRPYVRSIRRSIVYAVRREASSKESGAAGRRSERRASKGRADLAFEQLLCGRRAGKHPALFFEIFLAAL